MSYQHVEPTNSAYAAMDSCLSLHNTQQDYVVRPMGALYTGCNNLISGLPPTYMIPDSFSSSGLCADVDYLSRHARESVVRHKQYICADNKSFFSWGCITLYMINM
ncbi:hypothetical protein BDQ17DRAFT_1367777 [Cyathus striatus]|nr:hypothetical protein BDQ17DRAFT_1367777 [Cyathus striatus]